MLTYHCFDPSGCGFPSPQVPLLPAVLGSGWTMARKGAATTDTRWYRRGRYALHAAYRSCGVGAQGPILLPAYHCRTMIDPAVALGAAVHLYPVRQDLGVDVDRLSELIRSAPVRPRALLATHYFGVRQPALGDIHQLCEQHGVSLIEDCSHAFVTGPSSARQLGIGSSGVYATSSFYKFVPSQDGALLWSNQSAPLPEQPKPASWRHEAAALWALGKGLVDSRGPRDLTTAGEPGPQGRHHLDTTDHVSASYLPQEQDNGALVLSRQLLLHADREAIRLRRRTRFQQWLDALRGVTNARPLFDSLPADCIPYMFPLLIDDPATVFAPLKRVGFPMFRWDSMAVSDCDVAASYRLRMVHLPCHQSLSDRQMAWMASRLLRQLAAART